MNIFDNNINALRVVENNIFQQLQKIDTNINYEVFVTDMEKLSDLKIMDNRDGTYIESLEDDLSIKLHEYEEFENYPYLYFFGIGSGRFYKELLKNKNHQRLMIFEPEIELIYIALNLVDFTEEIIDKRLEINFSKNIDKAYYLKSFLNNSKFYLKVYDFHIYSSYYNRYENDYIAINKEIINALKHSLIMLGNDMDDALMGLEHSLHNFPKMLKSPTLKQILKKATLTETVIIVATGPSLDKQLEELKRIQKYVTILSLDASFTVLTQNGIKPDIVFSLERIKEVAHLFAGIDKKAFEDVLFLLPSLTHQKAIESIPTEINFFIRWDFYTRFFEFDDWGYLGGGSSVANIAYDFAVKSDFKNIVLIGQDLSFSLEGKSHAQKHAFGEDDVSVSEKNEYIEAYGGKGKVRTTAIWKSFLNFFVLQIKENSKLTINATEGGARISGAEELSLKEVSNLYIDFSQEKEKISLTKPSSTTSTHYLNQLHSKILEAISIGKRFNEEALHSLQALDDFLLETKNYSQKDIKYKVTMDQLAVLLAKIDATSVNFNVEPFSLLYAPLLTPIISNHSYEEAQVVVMKTTDELSEKLKKMDWIKTKYKWYLLLISNINKIISVYEKNLSNH